MPLRIALTGGTGFIGRHLLPLLHEAGHEVRQLRRMPGDGQGSRGVVVGSLADRAALDGLARDRDVLVHVAGTVRAVDPGDFRKVNAEGTRLVAEAAQAAGVKRMVLVSSLAARHPEASVYARSKAEGEAAARSAFAGTLAVLRPPAVYGPFDRVTLPIFAGLAGGLLAVPGTARQRFSLLHVRDLARLIARLAEKDEAPSAPLEPHDGRGAYDWAALAAEAGRALKRRVRVVLLPRGVMAPLAVVCDGLARGLRRPLPLSRDKLGELYHLDWVGRTDTVDGWRPAIDFGTGVVETLAWYRRAGWIGGGT